MEYDSQPLQYVSSHYFQIKSEDDENYKRILGIMDALANLPFIMMPLISYLVVIYIYPMISFHLKQYLQTPSNFFHVKLFENPDDVDEQKAKLLQEKTAQTWKRFHLICLFLTSFILTMILVALHIASASAFIDYGNEVLLDKHKGFPLSSDHYISYIHAVMSYSMVIIVFVVAIAFSICAWNLNSLISVSISVNVIYTICYFFPAILLAFIHDPLQIVYTCFMAAVFIMFIYTLIWCFGLALLSRLLLKQDHFTCFSLKTLIHFMLLLTIVLLIHMFFVMIINMVALENFSDFKELKSIMLSLLIGLLSVSVLKPARNHAYKLINNNVKGDEEGSSTHSDNHVDQDCINHSTKDSCDTKEEMDSLLQNDENTIV